jgi:alanine-synthesizing transaminase
VSYRFSARTGWDVGESGFAAAIREARVAGRGLVDLTVSNPTACGFEYDAEGILAPLARVGGLTYDPDPRGMRSARVAVAGYYADHGAGVDPDAVVLTTSTSEGYGYLFRLLCDAGDEVLVAQPSYPLFDFLADLEDVRLRTYPLFYDYGWWIDFAELERRIGPRTKAIVVVHPNNPTGHATGAGERARLQEICARHGLALIVDEVFLDYPLGESRLESFAAGAHSGLTFVLSGMSKIAGLPQMKVGWVVGLGPDGVRREALGRLEVIADTFLSMSAPVQLALPGWLAGRQGIQRQILERVRGNLKAAVDSGVEVLRVEAGWSAILRLPQRSSGGDAAEELLREADVVVHPGSFYGIAEAGRVVVSLIGAVEEFAEGMQRIVSWTERNQV